MHPICMVLYICGCVCVWSLVKIYNTRLWGTLTGACCEIVATAHSVVLHTGHYREPQYPGSQARWPQCAKIPHKLNYTCILLTIQCIHIANWIPMHMSCVRVRMCPIILVQCHLYILVMRPGLMPYTATSCKHTYIHSLGLNGDIRDLCAPSYNFSISNKW